MQQIHITTAILANTRYPNLRPLHDKLPQMFSHGKHFLTTGYDLGLGEEKSVVAGITEFDFEGVADFTEGVGPVYCCAAINHVGLQVNEPQNNDSNVGYKSTRNLHRDLEVERRMEVIDRGKSHTLEAKLSPSQAESTSKYRP